MAKIAKMAKIGKTINQPASANRLPTSSVVHKYKSSIRFPFSLRKVTNQASCC